jgi:RimJ/RimL family protein N-acetyltransferase
MESATPHGWRAAVPVLSGDKVTLRELTRPDATNLFVMFATEEVARFISPPPTTVDGFERFIERTHVQRADGESVCFAVVPRGGDTAVGLFQVRRIEPEFKVAEWGFAIGSFYWGSGMFADAARLVVDFAFETIGIERLEARAALCNGRGNGALKKIGAVRERVLQESLQKNGEQLDEALWTIARRDWKRIKPGDGGSWSASPLHSSSAHATSRLSA